MQSLPHFLLSSGRFHKGDFHKSEKGWFPCLRFHMFIPLGGSVLLLLGAKRGISAYDCMGIGVFAFQRFFPGAKQQRKIMHYMCQHVQIKVIKVIKELVQDSRICNSESGLVKTCRVGV